MNIIKYKLYPFQEGEILYINDDMDLIDYLWYLNQSRHFNKGVTINHTLKYYGIDLTEAFEQSHFFWEYKTNEYEEFYKTIPKDKLQDDGTRKYFNTYGRKLYLEFMDFSLYNKEADCLNYLDKYSDIHHIHPLVYGGGNSIGNLIHLSQWHHDLLHENPLENDEKYCNQALDYLGQLYSERNIYKIIEKYDLAKYEFEMFVDVFKASVKQEMRQFYKRQLEKYKSNSTSITSNTDIEEVSV